MAHIDGTTPPVDEPREFDLGVLGATGFVGKLISDYLCRNYLHGGKLKFVLAGRNASRLENLKVQLCKHQGVQTAAINTAVADVADYSSLVDLAKRCKVLISTVGPYMLHGEPVARACVEAKTHYCDITGEMPFVVMLHKRHGQAAKERGVKLISFCGFDSVPSDISVYMIQKKATEKEGRPCPQVKMAVRSLRGGYSGSTLASALNLLGHQSMTDPYYLATHAVDAAAAPAAAAAAAAAAAGPAAAAAAGRPVQPRVCMVHQDPDFGYSTFFVMSRVNENVVRWTNALQSYPYGHNFIYYEMLACSFNIISVVFAMLTTYLSLFIVSFPPSRCLGRLLGFIPPPGGGPKPEVLNGGYFCIEAVGRVNNKKYKTRIESKQGDPGYKETAKMVVECALCLVFDLNKCSKMCGVLSPAAGIGEPLVYRLNKSGITCEINEEEEGVRPAVKKQN